MRPKPTPGPWHVVGCKGGSLIEAAGGERVVRGAGGVRHPADAMLIAAAPELLAACEALLADMTAKGYGVAMDLARAAINKAKWPLGPVEDSDRVPAPPA